jgi:hypothetical protein
LQNGPERSRARRLGAAERTLDGEDRSETVYEERKERSNSIRFLKRNKRNGCMCIWQPEFYLRLVAYSFVRLSEGAWG